MSEVLAGSELEEMRLEGRSGRGESRGKNALPSHCTPHLPPRCWQSGVLWRPLAVAVAVGRPHPAGSLPAAVGQVPCAVLSTNEDAVSVVDLSPPPCCRRP